MSNLLLCFVVQIKRMQQLDEESAMLKRGLEMVDMARDWYLRQLAAVQDKQRMLGKVNYNVSAALRIARRFMATFPCCYYWTVQHKACWLRNLC